MLRRVLRIILIPLLLLGLGYGVQQLSRVAFEQLMAYPGPDLGPLPPGRGTAPVSGRVIVIVVDGLREDTSRQMPAFQALRERGADLPSWTELPSISRPGYTALGTGAYPGFSGVTTNWYDEPVRVDNLLARAQEAGLQTGLVGMDSWDTLYGPWATFVYTAPWSESGHDPQAVAWTTGAIGQEARRLLQEEEAALLYVHFGEADEAGHAYGGTSEGYLEAALHVDAEIAALAEILDWSQDTLILTADHGMTAWQPHSGGGHGGGEVECRRVPLVMVGRGVAPGVYPDGGQADVAPTVAALLGLPIPAHSQGRTRLDVLVLTPEERADKALALGQQQEALYTAYLRALGAPTEADGLGEARAAVDAGEHGAVVGLVWEYLGRLDAAVERAAANRLWYERTLRLPYLLLPLLLAALFVGLYRPRRELLRPFLLTLLFFLLYAGLYWGVRGRTLSFSAIGALSEEAFFLTRTLDAVIVTVVVAAVSGIIWWRRPWEEVVWGANQAILLIAWTFVGQIGLFLWLYGLVMTWRMPDLGWGFKFYLDLLATTGVGYAGFLLPWVALGVSRLILLVRWLVRRWRQAGLSRRLLQLLRFQWLRPLWPFRWGKGAGDTHE